MNLARAITARPLRALLLLAVVTLGLGQAALGVKVRYQIEDFFPQGTPERATYERLREAFGRDDRLAMLIVESQTALDADAFARIAEVSERLSEAPEIEGVLSPSNAFVPVRDAEGRVRLQRAAPKGSASAARLEDLRAIFTEPPYRNAVVSADGRIGVIGALLTEESLDLAGRKSVMALFEKEAAGLEAHGYTTYLAGYPLHRLRLTREIGHDVRVFYSAAVALILVLFGLVFRSGLAVLMPALVIAVTAVWTTGIMALCDLPPNMLAPAAAIMVTVVGVSDVAHLMARHRDLVRAGSHSGSQAVEEALRDVLGPCALTSVTSAIGFASLLLTGLPMVAHLGAQIALGILAAFAATVLLVPALLRFVHYPPASSTPGAPGEAGAPASPSLGARLVSLGAVVTRRPGRIALGFLVVALACIPGLRNVEVNARLLADLDEEHIVRRTNRFIEARLGGVIPLDVLIEPAAGKPVSAFYGEEALSAIGRLTERLRDDPAILDASSPVDPLRQLVKVLERVPPEEATSLLPTALLLAHDQLRAWVDVDGDAMRVRLRIRDLDTRDAFALYRRVERACEEELGDAVRWRLTGQGYLAQMVNARIVDHFGWSLVVAVAAVLAVLGLALRSVRLVALSLLPNLFPLLVILALMGSFAIPVQYTSALVLVVVFGLAVDDTIHFMAHLRVTGEGDPIERAYRHAGPGIVVTTLVLAVSFSVLLGSRLESNRLLGLLIGCAALSALAADLLLLPALCALTGAARPTAGPTADRSSGDPTSGEPTADSRG